MTVQEEDDRGLSGLKLSLGAAEAAALAAAPEACHDGTAMPPGGGARWRSWRSETFLLVDFAARAHGDQVNGIAVAPLAPKEIPLHYRTVHCLMIVTQPRIPQFSSNTYQSE